MKKFKFALLCILTFLLLPQFLYSQCYTPPAWEKKLANSTTYKWYFDPGFSNVKIWRSGGILITNQAQITSIVKSIISAGFSKWLSATQVGIQFSETTDPGQANVKISFTSQAQDGHTDQSTKTITLNESTNWTDDVNLVSSYVDIYYTIVHEIGHIFLGDGHASYSLSIMYASPPTYVKRNLHSCDIQIAQNIYSPEHIVTAKNSFGGNGVMKIDGASAQTISAAGFNSDALNWREFNWNHSLEAVDDQTVSGLTYVQRFDNWTDNVGQTNETNLYLPIQPVTKTYTANFSNRFNIVFQTSTGGGTITIDGQGYSSFPTPVIYNSDGTAIQAITGSHTQNYFQYSFTQWKDDLNRTYSGANHTFTPDGHRTYTAYFDLEKPVFSNRSLTSPSAVGQSITLTWSDHPNSSVSYKIYRQVKHNGVTGPEELIGSKPHGTTTFTDNAYTKTSSYVDLIKYDVRAYYSPNGSYSDPAWISIYGETLLKQSVTKEAASNEYTLSNFPNPFNPSTNIEFNLPEASTVKLIIYNVLGEQVKEIINSYIPAGSYSVIWNGDNRYGNKVNSGIYFTVLETNKNRIVQKMILSK